MRRTARTTIPTTNSTWPRIPLAASSSPGRQQPERREGREHLFLHPLATQGRSVWVRSSRCSNSALACTSTFYFGKECNRCVILARKMCPADLEGAAPSGPEESVPGHSSYCPSQLSRTHNTVPPKGSTGTRAKAGITSWCDEGSDRLEPPDPELTCGQALCTVLLISQAGQEKVQDLPAETLSPWLGSRAVAEADRLAVS